MFDCMLTSRSLRAHSSVGEEGLDCVLGAAPRHGLESTVSAGA